MRSTARGLAAPEAPADGRPPRPSGARPLLVLDRLSAWRHGRLGGLSLPGLALAALCYVLANTPSLLPRPWWLQGLIAALCAVLGYVVGYLVGALWGGLARWAGLVIAMDRRRARTMLGILLAAVALGVLAFPFLTIRWQRYVTQHVGQEPPGWGYPLGSTLVAIVVFALCISLWRLVAGLLDWFLVRVRSRILREVGARIVATLLTLATLGIVLDAIARPAVLAAVDRSASRVNRTAPVGKQAPLSPLRSGGPGSPWSWESLGQDGAIFVSSGPDAQGIRTVTGQSAKEPIRVFVGVGAPIPQTADAVIAELDRTKAWERRAILVVTATSTGYINTWGSSAFEYLQGGDTAIASMAYSDLPSAFGLLTAGQDPPRAGRELLDRVRARVAALSEGHRPRVYVMGESLGAYGSEGSFVSPDQALREVDGAVWSGTPMFAPNRSRLTVGREPGSTTIVPVIENGKHIRFAGEASELTTDEYGRQLGPWSSPRLIYLQHPSDPVAWWSTDLLFSSPQWLRETRQDTPMAQMTWTPLVTFWQVTADMLVSNNVPGGFGHRYYGPDMVPAWAAVLGLDLEPSRMTAIIDAVGR